jgi:sulfide:quinone oxidoreductase
MLQIKPLTSEFSVSPQILLDDLPTIARLGFKSIINNRPDGEDKEQPSHQVLQQKCTELGMKYQYLPVISGQITKQNSQDMNDYLNELEKPILAFCRTGTRSCLLWLGTASDSQTLEDGMQRAKTQGYAFNIGQIPSLING